MVRGSTSSDEGRRLQRSGLPFEHRGHNPSRYVHLVTCMAPMLQKMSIPFRSYSMRSLRSDIPAIRSSTGRATTMTASAGTPSRGTPGFWSRAGRLENRRSRSQGRLRETHCGGPARRARYRRLYCPWRRRERRQGSRLAGDDGDRFGPHRLCGRANDFPGAARRTARRQVDREARTAKVARISTVGGLRPTLRSSAA